MPTIETQLELQSLAEEQWQSAHAIAIELVKNDTDVNELRKVISYLRTLVNKPDAGSHFFKYIKALVRDGNKIGHSGKTVDYYKNFDRACDSHLRNYQSDTLAMLQILGWVSRLMRYYKVAPITELETPLQEESSIPDNQALRLAEIKASIQSRKFEVGDIINAKVISKKDKGKEVTYEIVDTSIRRNNKEPKKFDFLSINQIVKVEISDVDDDGIPRKIRRLE